MNKYISGQKEELGATKIVDAAYKSNKVLKDLSYKLGAFVAESLQK